MRILKNNRKILSLLEIFKDITIGKKVHKNGCTNNVDKNHPLYPHALNFK